jgi:hypothetical protein
MRTESAGQVAVLLAVATLVSLLLVAALSAEAKNIKHTSGKSKKKDTVVDYMNRSCNLDITLVIELLTLGNFR